jgi:hypothetical protein
MESRPSWSPPALGCNTACLLCTDARTFTGATYSSSGQSGGPRIHCSEPAGDIYPSTEGPECVLDVSFHPFPKFRTIIKSFLTNFDYLYLYRTICIDRSRIYGCKGLAEV